MDIETDLAMFLNLSVVDLDLVGLRERRFRDYCQNYRNQCKYGNEVFLKDSHGLIFAKICPRVRLFSFLHPALFGGRLVGGCSRCHVRDQHLLHGFGDFVRVRDQLTDLPQLDIC